MTTDRDTLRRLHAAGLTASEIAEAAGCTTRTVQRFRTAEGLAQPKPLHACEPITEERLDAADAMFADGASMSEVRRTLGMGWTTLQHYFPGRGWSKTDGGRYGQMVRALEDIEPIGSERKAS